MTIYVICLSHVSKINKSITLYLFKYEKDAGTWRDQFSFVPVEVVETRGRQANVVPLSNCLIGFWFFEKTLSCLFLDNGENGQRWPDIRDNWLECLNLSLSKLSVGFRWLLDNKTTVSQLSEFRIIRKQVTNSYEVIGTNTHSDPLTYR